MKLKLIIVDEDKPEQEIWRSFFFDNLEDQTRIEEVLGRGAYDILSTIYNIE